MHEEQMEQITRKIRNSVAPFVVLLVVFIVLCLMVLRPLGRPLMWSVVLSYFTYPLYKFLEKRVFRGRLQSVAAGLTTATIIFFMLIPMILFGLFLAKEVFRIYGSVVSKGLYIPSYTDIMAYIHSIPVLGKYVSSLDPNVVNSATEMISNGLVIAASKVVRFASKQIVSNAFKIFYLLAVVTISSFFLVRDGHSILSYFRGLIPLPEASRTLLFARAARMLRAVVYGIIFTAAVQGSLGGLGWWYVGLPHPVFFGFLMFIGGMIPFVGTPVVWIPGSIYLLCCGHYLGCVILLAWGFGVVSMIDNFIRPVFISEGSKVHMLVIFIGIFGGLYNWGFLGLFVGPLVLSLGIFMLDVYKAIVDEKLPVSDVDIKTMEGEKS